MYQVTYANCWNFTKVVNWFFTSTSLNWPFPQLLSIGIDCGVVSNLPLRETPKIDFFSLEDVQFVSTKELELFIDTKKCLQDVKRCSFLIKTRAFFYRWNVPLACNEKLGIEISKTNLEMYFKWKLNNLAFNEKLQSKDYAIKLCCLTQVMHFLLYGVLLKESLSSNWLEDSFKVVQSKSQCLMSGSRVFLRNSIY